MFSMKEIRLKDRWKFSDILLLCLTFLHEMFFMKEILLKDRLPFSYILPLCLTLEHVEGYYKTLKDKI